LSSMRAEDTKVVVISYWHGGFGTRRYGASDVNYLVQLLGFNYKKLHSEQRIAVKSPFNSQIISFLNSI